MSYIPPPPPIQYGQYGYYDPNPGPKRPTSLNVLAIIGIILGAMGVVCSPIALLPLFGIGPDDAVSNALRINTAYFVAGLIEVPISFLLSAYLLVASICALKLKFWARRGMLAYGWIQIVLAVLQATAGTIIVSPILNGLVNSSDPEVRMNAIVHWISPAGGAVIALIYPIFILVFMNRPKVKEAFDGAVIPPAVPYVGPVPPPAGPPSF